MKSKFKYELHQLVQYRAVDKFSQLKLMILGRYLDVDVGEVMYRVRGFGSTALSDGMVVEQEIELLPSDDRDTRSGRFISKNSQPELTETQIK